MTGEIIPLPQIQQNLTTKSLILFELSQARMPTDFDRTTLIPRGMGRLLYKTISMAIMSQGRLTRFPLLGCLLIVLSIQSIVPDAHDLASMQPLRLLAGVLPESASLNQEDEWPDDVCDPMTSRSAIGRPESHRLVEEYAPYFDRMIL